MKLTFTSDIHRPSPAMERVPKLSAQSGTQWPVILGGVLNHGPRNVLPEGYAPAKVAEWLNEAVHKIVAVRGNCNGEVDQVLLHFPIAVLWQQVLLERQRLSLTYGHLFGSENPLALNQNGVLTYGHTHLPVAEWRGGIFCFNPGSVSIPKGGNSAGYGMLDNDVPSVIVLNDQSIITQVAINP